MEPLLENCLHARLADHFSGDDFALRCHDDFGEALFKPLAAVGLSNFRDLARGLELQLFRGGRGVGLFRGGSTVVVSYRAGAYRSHISWRGHGHEHLRPCERLLAARHARHRQVGEPARKLARWHRGAGGRFASGQCRGTRFARRVVAKIQQLQPDAVLISGDLFDGSKADLDALLKPWKGLSAPAGAYFVTGNHEEFTDRAQYLDAVERAGIRVLNNEKVEINGLQLVGVHDAELHDPPLFRAALQGAKLDRNRPSILLAHQPLNLAIPEEEGVSLQLSGHTHGGQLWPWTQVAARVHGRFNRGLNRFGKLLVLTSNGVGTWGTPMRVGTMSEIILIRLAPA